MDRLAYEKGLWVVYRHSEDWGDCPVYRTKDRESVKALYNL